MTPQSQTTEQKRLHSCVLGRPKWAKINENLEKRACVTLKIKDAVANAAVRVENAHQNGQTRHNTILLGKYQLIRVKCIQNFFELRVRNRLAQVNAIDFGAKVRRKWHR